MARQIVTSMDGVAERRSPRVLRKVVSVSADLAVLRKVDENQLWWARSRLRWVATNKRIERSRGAASVK